MFRPGARPGLMADRFSTAMNSAQQEVSFTQVLDHLLKNGFEII